MPDLIHNSKHNLRKRRLVDYTKEGKVISSLELQECYETLFSIKSNEFKDFSTERNAHLCKNDGISPSEMLSPAVISFNTSLSSLVSSDLGDSSSSLKADCLLSGDSLTQGCCHSQLSKSSVIDFYLKIPSRQERQQRRRSPNETIRQQSQGRKSDRKIGFVKKSGIVKSIIDKMVLSEENRSITSRAA